MHALAERYAGRFAFLSVYLAEAHATDEFPLGNHVQVRRHASLAERATAAQRFAAAVGWKLPLWLDTMDDALTDALAAHPERFYVVAPAEGQCARLLFYAPSRYGGYQLDDLEDFLRASLRELCAS